MRLAFVPALVRLLLASASAFGRGQGEHPLHRPQGTAAS